jgi:hypothetical protein
MPIGPEYSGHLTDWIIITPGTPGGSGSINPSFGFYEEIVVAPKQVFTLPLGKVYAPGNNALVVTIDGVEQSLASGHYTETNDHTITFPAPIQNAVVKFRWW